MSFNLSAWLATAMFAALGLMSCDSPRDPPKPPKPITAMPALTFAHRT